MSQRNLIKNANLITMAENQPIAGLNQILIENGRIAAIDKDLGISDTPVIDAQGAIVMPGMVDTHRHVWQSLLRAQLGDGSLFDYMAKIRFGFAPQFTAEEAKLGNYVGALDALNSGVTTVVDHAHLISTPDHADALLSGLESAGIRAVFCYGFADVFDPGEVADEMRSYTTTWRHEDAKRIRDSRLSSNDGLIRFGIGGSEFLFAPLKYTENEINISRQLDAHLFSVHVANGPFARGTRYVSRLLKQRLIDERTLLVHGNVLTQKDLKQLSKVGASISTTPETEVQMGMGTPIWPMAKKSRVACGLGADVVSGNSGDLFTQMRLALATGRMAENDKLGKRGIMPDKLNLTAEDVLRAATIEGARAARLDKEIGSIEVGKQADLIFIKTDGLHIAPNFDPIKTVVMQAGVADVDMVMVNGRILKSKGKLTIDNQQELSAKATQAGFRIVEATSDKTIKDAYIHNATSFPLTRKAALGARFAAWALRVPGLDEFIFKKIHSRSR
ncbi:amidohydrolase family protein [Aquimarina sp. 2201CG5-10]|uniref:amidohydrolase family protein n=1 Tax=Aquimarina callyspongiae TaxID=3098150 RepID=UPI002AB4202B|nr:amidohydrolase family protein [Aquimarina sp. 2201CG5-10]MDY8137473.1 amidohydrolase family protein [Aquimarina sp. 2201CG5-10]